MERKNNILQNSLLFILFGHLRIKAYNDDMAKRLKLKKLKYDIREKQKNKPYIDWLKYIKKRHIYSKYVNDLKEVWLIDAKLGRFQFFDQVAFTPVTVNHTKEVAEYIDIQLNKHYWGNIFQEFEMERDLDARKKILARKLYHMDVPKTTHHSYIGSCKPSSHFIDKLIDKIFFIKRKER